MRLRSIISHARITQSLQFLFRTYTHDPLPSSTCIRLLEIVPATDKNQVRCFLKTFELKDAPSYKALSYTWGNSQVSIPRSTHCFQGMLTHLPACRKDGSSPSDEIDTGASSGNRRHSIICNGGIMKVTGNLRDALYMLANAVSLPQMPRIPSYYWIDALCIDQRNIPERNSQVARMADIYTKADGVVVWLGKEDEFTVDALATIQAISAIPESDWPLVPYTSFYDPDMGQSSYCPRLTFYNWLGFIALINRPWFRRVWVVQEIALAKSAVVVCGTKVFSWEKLSRTLSFIKATKWYHHLHTEKLKHIRTLQKHPGVYKRILQSKLSVGISPVYLNETRMTVSASAEKGILPLQVLLHKHRFSKSSDPRDKIYAFLGLVDRHSAPFSTRPLALTPDYNLSVQSIYTEVARTLIASRKDLHLLSNVEDPSKRRIRGLPSWVPDYTVPLDPYPLRYRGPEQWKASKNVEWIPNAPRMANGLLDVQGYRLDYIDQTSALLDEYEDPSASWASIVKLALSLDLPYPDPSKSENKPSRVEVLWRTLTTDIYARTHPAPFATGSLFIDYILNLQIRHRLMPWSSADKFQPHHSPLSESIYPEWRTLLGLEPPESPYSLDLYKKRLSIVVESMFNGTYSPIGLAQLQHELDQSSGNKRRLFKTQGGYMGTGPRSLRKDDEVWVLHGGDLPFVLRQQANGKYRLIGESFVYGVMHGEAEDLGLQTRYITIE